MLKKVGVKVGVKERGDYCSLQHIHTLHIALYSNNVLLMLTGGDGTNLPDLVDQWQQGQQTTV